MAKGVEMPGKQGKDKPFLLTGNRCSCSGEYMGDGPDDTICPQCHFDHDKGEFVDTIPQKS